MSDDNEKNFYADRAVWLDYLNTRRDLTHGDFRVAYFIASKINPRDECMWWSVSAIAEQMSVSIATVTGATARLQHAGLLVITKAQHGSNRYSIRMPIDPNGAAYQVRPLKKTRTGGRLRRVSETETE